MRQVIENEGVYFQDSFREKSSFPSLRIQDTHTSIKNTFPLEGIFIMAFVLRLFVLFTVSFTGLSLRSFADGWDSYNDPALWDSHYEYRLQALPLVGTIEPSKRPWSESYWPRNKGSINIRWNAPGTPGFDYHSPSKSEVMNMTLDQLKQLSPAEKFDLAQGHYDYPLTTHVALVNAKQDAKDYEGVCDGWTATALQFREPKPVTYTNPDGIVIPFGSSDVKAVMAYYTSFNSELGPSMIGRYCQSNAGITLNSARCADINPGTYHVILANEIGLKATPFATDVEIGKETWNQPVFGFEFTIVGSAKSNADRAVQVHAKMHYTDELDHSSWTPVTGTDKFVDGVQETDYILEMDSSGRITGGSWISKRVHPDLFWKPTLPIHFDGDFAFINKIYQPM